MKEYFKLLKFVRPYTAKFSLAVVCMAFSAVFDGATLAMMVPLADKVLNNKPIVVPAKLPLFVSRGIEAINGAEPLILLKYMAVSILVLFFLKGLFSFLQGYIMSDIGQRVVRDIRAKLYAKMHSLSLDYFIQKRQGELVSRITNDVRLVENAVSYGSTDLVYQTLQVAIFAFLTVFIYTKLAIVSLVLVPFISLPILKVGKVLRKLSKKTQEKMADINSLLAETITGTRIVKAFNMEHHEIAKFRLVNHEYYRLSMKSVKRILLLSPATEFLGAVAGVFVFFVGGRDVIAGKISFGVFGLFLGSMMSLIRPFKKLSQVNSVNQQAVAASERIHEVLEARSSISEKKDALKLTGFSDSVVFEDVWFNYGPSEILKGIQLRVKKGQTCAIVGSSGSGKTTLMDLVPRFYDVRKGKVLIDGQDVKEVDLKSLRHLIGIVSQETILFNDTIRANIAYGRPEAARQEIEDAASLAHAHEFILHLPMGYDTVIGDRGMKLSGGERQRIAIARALLKDPPILLLDEATSQLDTESERIVQVALERLMQGRTVFVIAHRLSTVRNAHRIIVLDKGKIAQDGTHGQLLAQEGLYKKLYQIQELP